MTNTPISAPQYQTHTLANGLRIVSRRNDAPVMYCGFMVDCGTRSELTPDLFGMAHFVEHILFKGTTHRDSWHINNRMESVGGELNAFTTKEETTFYAIGLNKDFERSCELLCDLICHPTAPQHELEKEQEVVIDEIMSYRDTPSELIYDEFENKLFANSPLGHNILGSEETVHSFDQKRCLSFIRQHYIPSRLIFFHQGSTAFERVVRTVERYFDLAAEPVTQNNSANHRQDMAPDAQGILSDPITILKRDTHQSHVLLGARSYPIGHPNAAALALLGNILGGPGMNSRLGLELRERRGLVYSVESSNTPYTDTGYFSIYFGCDHHDVNRCLRICHKQLDLFRRMQLSARQLLNAQNQFCGQMGVGMANLENNAIALAKNTLRLGHVDNLEQTCQRIMAVTPALINQVANEVFNESMLKTVIIQ